MGHMLNLENLFNLFTPKDLREENKTYLDFENQPLYFCGMWKKLILNHVNFSKKVINFFKQSNGEFDIDDIREAILSFSNDEFIATLEMGIKHFQSSEEYEKCAKILKIKNISRKN